ncbi:endonuclease/exonuclease/phosphatase family protein [Sphingobacterium faecale]|uniref:Endonuclease/exonuclease/phosphatase family protein n=1 Tax=Sphingobacterium faecale TaxID=2803775 RepID=A0ABS1R012_9SPHI|nr:endonuclease/exonuclease/phosphatase family protein [Sphingobacterium faecale]MBL1408034.1 endonuclease/exonuclease/phosphatase family protein [Sphingobacterium faecale]
MKRILWVFIVFLIFLGCKSQQIHFNKEHNGATFKVATYNIRYDAAADQTTGNPWVIRKEPLARLITSHGFDILGTQEGSPTQMDELLMLLPGFEQVNVGYGGKDGNLHTCAVLYKTALFELLDSGVFWLSETPDIPSIGWDATDRRICQWAKMKDKKSGQVFYFFNAHLYWRNEIARRESGPLIVRKIQEIADIHPVLIVGDFNSEPNSSQVDAMKAVFADSYDISDNGRKGKVGTAFPGGIFQGEPGGRIDYIFVDKTTAISDYEVYSDVYGDNRYPSDHLPVSCQIRF